MRHSGSVPTVCNRLGAEGWQLLPAILQWWIREGLCLASGTSWPDGKKEGDKQTCLSSVWQVGWHRHNSLPREARQERRRQTIGV